MDVHLESFSLRHIIPQFRQFNLAVHDNRARLGQYFWWARSNNFLRFNFILSGLIMEQISRIMCDLPYNKKFIIRTDGEFSGVIGLDGAARNAPRAEVWYFVTHDIEGQHVASTALKHLECFAREKSIEKLYARTSRDNRKSQYLLARNDYYHYYPTGCDSKNRETLMWCKYLNDKVIEK